MRKMDKNVRTCEELLLDFENKNSSEKTIKLKFALLNEPNCPELQGKDVYNITAPFDFCGQQLLLGRVESRDSEVSQIVFFTHRDGAWSYWREGPVLDLQDPFITKIGNELILGGVEVFPDPLDPAAWSYRTVFYRGSEAANLKRFAVGPDRMKDIRLLQLPQGGILVLTRPQGESGGRGKIGYTVISGLEELGIASIEKAVIWQDQFIPSQWGGANELHLLSNNMVGVLSHIACFDERGDRHYYSSCFCMDPRTGAHTPMKLLAERKNFAPGAAKREDLQDVIFSGGLIRRESGAAELYCGVSDAEAHMIVIEDPFLEYEKDGNFPFL